MRATNATRFIAAIALLALAAGTVLAVDPSPSASDSASANPSGDLVSSEPSAGSASSEPSASPEASEAPGASESAEPSAAEPLKESQAPDGSEAPEGSEAPDASEAPEGSEAPDASEAPEAADESDGPPTAAEAADIVARLQAAGITTTSAELEALAAKVGTGGAVRTLAFANASGKTPAQILALFEGGMGWGQIKHELGLSIGPGIGWIMGHGHGHDKDKTHGNGNGNGKSDGSANPSPDDLGSGYPH